MTNIGFSGVANFAYTHPGTALSVNANANAGWGNAVGGEQVVLESSLPPAYFVLMESSGYILLEDGGKIALEIS